MKHYLAILAFLPLLLTGCLPTRIVTVSPNNGYVQSYTTVTVPRTRTQTLTTQVYPVNDDICLHLDLQAVGAAFAQASTVQEFESLLNNSSYILSNLDLNNDGYVDYLRVLETVEGTAHVFLIQAVLANNVYQDVATLVAEVPSLTGYHVQVIGAPYIYGTNYIIQPVYFTRPLILSYLLRAAYTPWRSPWYWSHFPSYYRRPAPIHLSHYQAYINTFMKNHRYCHEFSYASSCHYPNYSNVSRSLQRNDYGQQHPERSFSVRTANSASSTSNYTSASASRAINAREIRERQSASNVTTTTSTARSARSTTSSSTSTSRSAATSSTSSSRSAATPSTGSTGRSAAASSTSSSRSAATPSTGSTGRSAAASSTSSSRSTSTGSVSRSASQTTSSRVSSSGSTETRIKTTNSNGSSSTVSRTSPSARSTSSSTSRSASSSSSRSASSGSNRSSSTNSSRR